MINRFIIGLVALLLVAVLGFTARAAGTDEDAQSFDRSIARVHSGSTFIDVSAAVYTGYITCITVEPPAGTAIHDAQVVIDLDGGDDAQSFAEAYTSETIQFAVGRKIQGQWRIDDELETATVAGDNADARSVTLNIGAITPTEDVRIYVRLSAEATDVELPYLFIYRAQERATFTDVSN